MIKDIVNLEFSGPLYYRELCAVMALDVANAFKSERWDRIEAALCRKRIPEYLFI